ncbi:Putative rRNA methylase [Caloramator quimbayensis]|uniref:Putative rRNA methylase n=1 Tax=Caloramator quimbayensis TaxID=1147123 RepID=A0A1T4X117_9CLOT|nr:class I SAM-dependent methyltransferase [Caloramator quimbayensis]SKA83127.1 Putative rRNA methylase [Caloramator quimbayensis]
MFSVVVKATQMAQSFVEKKLCEYDNAVDATLGNGNDTIFLSNILKKGIVYSFDIQKIAVDNFKETAGRLNISNVIAVNDGHENMDRYINKSVKAVMFNLGYLPKGDINIVTKAETTLKALKKGLNLLMTGGIITIVAYPHEEGRRERDEIFNYLKSLNPKDYAVMEIGFINRYSNSPSVIVIEKNSSSREDI